MRLSLVPSVCTPVATLMSHQRAPAASLLVIVSTAAPSPASHHGHVVTLVSQSVGACLKSRMLVSSPWRSCANFPHPTLNCITTYSNLELLLRHAIKAGIDRGRGLPPTAPPLVNPSTPQTLPPPPLHPVHLTCTSIASPWKLTWSRHLAAPPHPIARTWLALFEEPLAKPPPQPQPG